MTFKNPAAAALAAAQAAGIDQSVEKQGGGEREGPAAGPCNLRLVSYIELGKHKHTYQGKEKRQDDVALTFELSGKNHPPIDTDNGPVPHSITVTENLSQNEKARFFKLFQLLNYKGAAKHTAELLGEAFRGKVIHRPYKGRDGKDRVAYELYDKKTSAWTITPPRVETVDEDGQPTGEFREVKVAAPLSPIRCFLFNFPDASTWESIYIDGEYPERKNEAGEVTAPAKSKNRFQLKIRSAVNFTGSPVEQFLKDGGIKLDLPADGVVDEVPGAEDEGAEEAPVRAVSKPPVTQPRAAKGNPLAGISGADDAN